MKFLTTLFLAATAATVHGYIIPDLPDGAYMVTLDANGTALHEPLRLGPLVSRFKTRVPDSELDVGALAKRDGVFCTGVALNPQNEHSAWLTLIAQCNGGVTTGGGKVGLMWGRAQVSKGVLFL